MSPIPLRSAQRAGHELRETGFATGSEAIKAGDWAALRAFDGEGGNPCLGIAIGCVLSLPIWLGLAMVSYLLR